LGVAQIMRPGTDLTLVATSWMVIEAVHAGKILADSGINVEIIDPRTLAPMDMDPILASVRKTGRLLIADYDWLNSGLSAEIAANVGAACFGTLKQPIERIGFAPTPCPTVRTLENHFYPNAETIIRTVEKMLGRPPMDLTGVDFFSHERRFRGPL